MPPGNVQWNINASFFEVARNVLPEICQLQRGAGGIGKLLTRFIAVAAEIKHQAANGIRGVNAVIEKRFPGRKAFYGLVLTKGFQQISERLPGKVLRNDGFAQRDKDGMRWAAFLASVQFPLPPVEQFQSALRIGDFIAEVVGPAAIGVEIVEMLGQFFRK